MWKDKVIGMDKLAKDFIREYQYEEEEWQMTTFG